MYQKITDIRSSRFSVKGFEFLNWRRSKKESMRIKNFATATRRSSGVGRKVILVIPLHAGNEEQKQRSTVALKPRAEVTSSSKRVSVALTKSEESFTSTFSPTFPIIVAGVRPAVWSPVHCKALQIAALDVPLLQASHVLCDRCTVSDVTSADALFKVVFEVDVAVMFSTVIHKTPDGDACVIRAFACIKDVKRTSGGSRIFQSWAPTPKGGGRQLITRPENFMKMKEIGLR